MLVAELRYVSSWFAIAGVFLVCVVIAAAVGRFAHLSAALSAGLFFALLGVWAYGWAALYLRKLSRSEATPVMAETGGSASPRASRARYSPVLIAVAILLFDAYLIATQYSRRSIHSVTHRVGSEAPASTASRCCA